MTARRQLRLNGVEQGWHQICPRIIERRSSHGIAGTLDLRKVFDGFTDARRKGGFHRLGRTALTEYAPVAKGVGPALMDGLSADETQPRRPWRSQQKQPREAMRGDGERRPELLGRSRK